MDSYVRIKKIPRGIFFVVFRKATIREGANYSRKICYLFKIPLLASKYLFEKRKLSSCYTLLMDILEGLNDAQREAVTHTEGPLLIVAGAGAGKTKTLIHRIAHLIDTGIPPESILAITFTNKAAKEMRERMDMVLGARGVRSRPYFATFHALGVYILRAHAETLGLPRHFAIADESQSLSYVKDAMKALSFDPKQYDARKIRGVISRQKGEAHTWEEYGREVSSSFGDMVARIWRLYEANLHKDHALDFDDLLLKTWLLLDGHEDIRKKWQTRFRYLHVDEYQDTNELQYRIARLLVGPEDNICVVGDTDQNIYSWRGANIKNILHFEQDYPAAKVVVLEENYRSTKTILAAANEVIKKNEMRKDKILFTRGLEGDKIVVCECLDESVEANFITESASWLIDHGVKPSDIAVLYRANFQSRILEEAFLRANIPYTVLGTRFFERKEIKDILSYIKCALNPESMLDFKRIINVPARGIGEKTLEKILSGQNDLLPATTARKVSDFFTLLEKIKEQIPLLSPSALIKFVVVESGIEKMLLDGDDDDKDRLENVRELVTVATAYDIHDGEEDSLVLFLDHASLASDQDTLMQNGGGVRLMTVHASKGLEFQSVFVSGLEQDLFPHTRFGDKVTKEEREEERRLMYVAITRAKEKLYLSYAGIRTIYGAREIHFPSEFISDIPDDLIEQTWRLVREDKSGDKWIYLE